MGGSKRITHAGILQGLHAANYVTNITGLESIRLHLLHFQMANFFGFIFFLGGHKTDTVALAKRTLHNPNINNGATVSIEYRIKNQRPQRLVSLASGGGNAFKNGLQQLIYSFA